MMDVKWVLIGTLIFFSISGQMTAKADPADINTLLSGVRAIGHEVPEADRMVSSCDGDAMCAARFLKDSIGAGVEIIPAIAPVPLRTGWGDRKAPMRVIPDPSSGGVIIEIIQFDVKFIFNIFNNLSVLPKRIVLNIRNLEPSEEFGELRRTVSLFTGKRDRAFRLTYATGREVDWQIPVPRKQWTGLDIKIMLDATTPGNGMAFAAMLQHYGNATIVGATVPEVIVLRRLVPIMHGWDMLVPTAEVRILNE